MRLFSVARGKPRGGRIGKVGDANRMFSYTILLSIFIALLIVSFNVSGYVVSVLLSESAMLITLLIYLLMKKNEALEILGLGKVKLIPIISSFIMGAALLPFFSMLNSISMQFVKNVTDTKVSEAVQTTPFLVMLFTVGFLPAVIEELFFRGAIFGAYMKTGLLKAAIWSAVLFGLMHGNLNQFAYAVVAGFIFAMTDQAGGSTVYSIIMHFVINSTSIVGVYKDKLGLGFLDSLLKEVEFNSVGEILKAYLIPSLIGILIAAFMYAIIKKYSAPSAGKLPVKIQKDTRIFDSTLAVGVIIMLINIIANEIL